MKGNTLIAFCLTFLMILGLISCKKEEKLQEPDLYGKWNWVSSKSKLHGNTITPQTEGYTQSIEFNTNGMIEFRHNDSLTSEKPFSIIHDASISTLPVIKLENDPFWMYSIKGDSLYLDNVCPNCFDDKYVRVK